MTWMVTISGKEFDLVNIDAQAIDINDIAYALGNINRYNGHARRNISVAEHSLLVANIFMRMRGTEDEKACRTVLAALMHDAHEAYFGDISTPVKAMIDAASNGALKREEDRVQRAVLSHFGLLETFEDNYETIKTADLIALATEKRDLMPTSPREWEVLNGVRPSSISLSRVQQGHSFWGGAFLHRFHELTAMIDGTRN